MSYVINKTTGEIIVTILDGTADGPTVNPGLNSTDIDLFGKNYQVFGERLNENFIRLLQNFSSTTQPAKPLQGELWYDLNTNLLKIYTGTSFIPVSPVVVANSAPATTVIGAQWWDQANRQGYTWNGTSWTLIGPSYKYTDGKSGAIVETVQDIYGGSHTVTKFYQQNNVIAISSYDAAFTLAPVSAVNGFSIVSPGLTLATGVANEMVITGSATNAKSLGNIAAANYARTDIVPTFTSNVLIAGGNIAIDSAPTGAARYYNTVTGANISLWPTVAGVSTRALSVWGADGSTNVQYNLNVNGAVATIGKDLVVGGNVTVYGTTSAGATGTGSLVFDQSPTLTGTPIAPTAAQGTVSTQIATTAFTNTAIATSSYGPWQGSHKYISSSAPNGATGNVGDFWFQI
jgi:hypothetical protein